MVMLFMTDVDYWAELPENVKLVKEIGLIILWLKSKERNYCN